jgi:uncharacterized protein YeaO (DUF488 family)
MNVTVRRVYDPPADSDGKRVLVDGLWPRGLSKQAAALDEWLRAIAPSAELRRWYGHDPGKFAEFRDRYEQELAEPERAAALLKLRELAASGPVSLLTATRDAARSHAAVLAERLAELAAAASGEERGGDPACWLGRVCPRCGTLADGDPPGTCPACGATW